VRVKLDERLEDEVRRFRLRFTCPDCGHYLPAEDACAHEWPNHEHRELGKIDDEVVFCKEFELR
jgi:hypothetical protein